MPVATRHLLAQGPVVAALVRTALARRGTARPTVPGPWLEAELAPRPPALVRDFIRHTGGDPAWYRGRLPPTLFPQWGLGPAARTLIGAPYPLKAGLNAGCRLEIKAPLPDDEPLVVRARLEAVDDDGRRAILTQRVVTGTRAVPDALVADLKVFVPLGEKGAPGQRREKRGKAPATVPADAKEIAFFGLGARAGLDFAKLTGDINPVHWLPAYARAAGFKGCILHGFATMARAVAAVERRVLAGDVGRLATIDVRFTGPLGLPARAGVYVGAGGALWVGDAPAGRAYLEGRFTLKETNHG
jgi:hypothetical protein